MDGSSLPDGCLHVAGPNGGKVPSPVTEDRNQPLRRAILQSVG